jgi:hypothetical protein
VNRIVSVLIVIILGCSSTTSLAQDPTARERELEELVRNLADRIDQLE